MSPKWHANTSHLFPGAPQIYTCVLIPASSFLIQAQSILNNLPNRRGTTAVRALTKTETPRCISAVLWVRSGPLRASFDPVYIRKLFLNCTFGWWSICNAECFSPIMQMESQGRSPEYTAGPAKDDVCSMVEHLFKKRCVDLNALWLVNWIRCWRYTGEFWLPISSISWIYHKKLHKVKRVGFSSSTLCLFLRESDSFDCLMTSNQNVHSSLQYRQVLHVWYKEYKGILRPNADQSFMSVSFSDPMKVSTILMS